MGTLQSEKRESYYDYMLRKSQEEDKRLGIDHRSDRTLIHELSDKVKRLEIDMAHLLRADD